MPRQIPCINGACRKPLQLDDALAGKQVRCPECGQVMVAPASEEIEVIAIHEAGPEVTTKRCPKCDEAWPDATALCVKCGFDFRTGRQFSVVKTREVRRTFRLNAFRHVGFVLIVLGGLFLFFALLGLLIGTRPLLALLCLLPSLLAVAAGAFLLVSCQAKVRVYRHHDGYLVCAIHYLLGTASYWRNEKYILPGDKLVLTHETHPVGIIIMLFLILCLVIPGVIWWWLLLKRRTMLTIQNDVTGRRQGFSLFWDDEALRELIKAVQEVEHVELVRR